MHSKSRSSDPDPDPRLDAYRCRVAIVHRADEPCGHLYLESDVWSLGTRGRWWRRTEWSAPQEAVRAWWVLGGKFVGDEYFGPDEFDEVLGNWGEGFDWLNGEQFRLSWQDRETSERLHADLARPPMGSRELRATVKALARTHMARDFPPRWRGVDIAGVDLVMLDADIAGCVDSWLVTGELDQDRWSLLERRCEGTVQVLPSLDRPAENIYVRGLQELALLVLSADRL